MILGEREPRLVSVYQSLERTRIRQTMGRLNFNLPFG